MIEKNKRHLLNGLLLLVFLSSCKKETSLVIQQGNQVNFNELKSLVSQVKLWHDSTVSSNLRTKVQNGVSVFSVNENDILPPVVDWDKAFINFDSSSVKSVTVPISMNYKNGENMQLVATKSKGKLNGYFIKITPDSSYYAKQNDIYDYTNFSGSISIYNLMGVRLKIQDFKSGIVLNSNNDSKAVLSNITKYDIATPCQGCTLVTVIVKAGRKPESDGGDEEEYDWSYLFIYDDDRDGDVIAGGVNKNSKTPCPGDVLEVPKIAATSSGNIKGGRFGLTRNGGTKMHKGIDLSATPNTPVFAGFEGRIKYVINQYPPNYYKDLSFGNYVIIEAILPDGKSVEIKYAHLNSTDLAKGDIVKPGDQIGLSGKTGNAQYIRNPHVHVEIMDKSLGKQINPEPYLATKFDNNGKSTGRPCN